MLRIKVGVVGEGPGKQKELDDVDPDGHTL